MSNDKNDEELTRDAEQLLRSFSPRPAQLDRDRLMFLAGQASRGDLELASGARQPSGDLTLTKRDDSRVLTHSARHVSWLWPLATAGMTTVAATLLVALVLRAEPAERIVIQEKIVYVQQSPPATPAMEATLVNRPASNQGTPPVLSRERRYLRARDLAIAGNIDAASAPAYRGSGAVSAPSSYRDLLEQLVPQKRAASASPGLSWPVLLLDEMNM